jgi:3-hydroxy-9,10-secoandrosta-1,3,5(10)-triene-9,17-dione monooxygenase reductase component
MTVRSNVGLEADQRGLRNAFGAFATGVTIVTARDLHGADAGLTANSFSSVSLKPPMILWSLSKTSSNIDAFHNAAHFAVHVLSAEQEALSIQFATKGIDKFAGLPLVRGPDDIPLLQDCAARFVCRTAYRHEGGDHVILVGEVLEFLHSESPPLVFHGGRYGTLFKKEAAPRANATDIGSRLSPDDLLYHVSNFYFRIRRDAIQERSRRGWTDNEYAVLSLLGRGDELPFADIVAISRERGRSITAETIEHLAARGLVAMAEPLAAGTKVGLTQVGRREIIEIIAMLKASEAEVLEQFDPSEVQLFMQIVRRASSPD